MNTNNKAQFNDRHYLWHLGFVPQADDSDSPETLTFIQELWNDTQENQEKTKVAIVDTGIDVKHPNIESAIDKQIDFGPSLDGVVYPGGDSVDWESEDFSDLNEFFKKYMNSQLETGWTDLSKDLKSSNFSLKYIEQQNRKNLDDPSMYFGAHGTACAGLVGGRSQSGDQKGTIPYFGVDPFCEIISYATPYSHEVLPVIHALLHAYLSGAQVILMPRGLNNIQDREEAAQFSGHQTRITTKDQFSPDGHTETLQPKDLAHVDKIKEHQAILEALLKFIAEERYLVLAAGNDGLLNAYSYPAEALKDDSNVFIVGAMNSAGRKSSYTNGRHEPKTVWMLSDDAVKVDKTSSSIDDRSLVGSDFNYEPHGIKKDDNTFDPWGVLTLDVRGNYGYASGGHRDPALDNRDNSTQGLYAIFGGTSAASSLLAGLISLLLSSKAIGPQKKPYSELLDLIEKKHYSLINGSKSS